MAAAANRLGAGLVVVGACGAAWSPRRLGRVPAHLAGESKREVLVARASAAGPVLAAFDEATDPAGVLGAASDEARRRECDVVVLPLPGPVSTTSLPAPALSLAILDAARRHAAGLIVLGRSGALVVSGARGGSVAELLLPQAPCSVLLVRGAAGPGLAEAPRAQ